MSGVIKQVKPIIYGPQVMVDKSNYGLSGSVDAYDQKAYRAIK